MVGAIDHLMINCNDYDAAVAFYSWLMPKIGYPNRESFDKPSRITGWFNERGSVWVSPSERQAGGQAFNKGRAGLREIAFRAESRGQIDELAKEIAAHGGRILDPPRAYDYRPGYYSVFFTDPDGIKLEFVHY